MWKTIELVLGITDKLLAKTPDYDERKREKFEKVKRLFKEEITKSYPERDDDLLMNLRDEILLQSSELNTHLEASK